jgi:putative acetyltransferase
VGMQLRAEQPRDHAAVRDVHLRAFGASGAKVATLVDALRSDDPAALGLVAELAGEVVGHVMFSRSLLDAPRRLVAVQVLSPLGVRPDHQRRGIGNALVRYGLQLLHCSSSKATPATTRGSASRPAPRAASASRRCAFQTTRSMSSR